MVCLNLIRRPSSVLLLTIATVVRLTKSDAFAFTSLTSAPTPLDHVHRIMTKRILTKSNSGSLNGKWDDLVDEDDIREDSTIPRDMRYIGFNILRQNRHFVDIRTASSPTPPYPLTADMYARSCTSTTFFFIGKVARVSDVSLERAVARQWGLIEEHAARLRPLELYKDRGELELWSAEGDSEMDVAYHRPKAVFTKMAKVGVEGSEGVRNVEVGFQGEIYDSGEDGFRIERKEDGTPAKSETKLPEKRAPTDEEMKDINKMFEGEDMGAMFDEQSKNSDTSL